MEAKTQKIFINSFGQYIIYITTQFLNENVATDKSSYEPLFCFCFPFILDNVLPKFTNKNVHKLTSGLDLSYAHVHHHGSGCVIGLHQGREVTAVHLTNVSQVRLAVVGHLSRALFVNIHTTI